MALYVNKLGAGIEDRTNSASYGSKPKLPYACLSATSTGFGCILARGTTAAQRADLTSEPWTWNDIAAYPTLC